MMTTFRPVRQVRAFEEVAEQLKEAIILGDFKAGDKLPSERELAEQFQVSRVTIREALRSLKNKGFVTTRQGATGGAFVTDLSYEHLVSAFVDLFMSNKISVPELFEVRALVEPEIARLAAERVTPYYAHRLKEALRAEKLPVASAGEDVDRKSAVHFILAEMCGNRFFEGLVRSTMGLTRKAILLMDSDVSYRHQNGWHDTIVEAVLAGDAESAAREMKDHSVQFGNLLLRMEDAYRHKAVASQASPTKPAAS